MAVAFPSSTAATSPDAGGNGDTDVDVSPPNGLTSGDVWALVAVLDTEAGEATGIQTPSDFTPAHVEVRGEDDGYPAVRTFWKAAGADESAVNVASVGEEAYILWAGSIRITSAKVDAPIGNVQVARLTGNGNVINAPDVTIQNDGSGVILIVANTGDMNGIVAAPGDEVIESREGNAQFPCAAISVDLADAGAYTPGNWQWTDAGQENRIAITIEILPAGGSVEAISATLTSGFETSDGDELVIYVAGRSELVTGFEAGVLAESEEIVELGADLVTGMSLHGTAPAPAVDCERLVRHLCSQDALRRNVVTRNLVRIA